MRRAAAALLATALACAPARPRLAPAPPLPEPVQQGGMLRLGRSWLRRAGPGPGILVGRFEGSPYEMGRAFGRLTRSRFHAQERFLARLFVALIPNSFTRAGVKQLSAFRLRGMEREIPEALLVTIAGQADGAEPEPPESGWSTYRRLLDLYALHDVSQRFIDTEALQSLCTGFVATGRATKDGATLVARNFDWEGGDIFDREKLVSVFLPEGRIPYLTVGFGGMLGVVSGLNADGLGVAVQAISGGQTAASGEPISLLLADVLSTQSTFAGAVERIRRARVFVSDLILLADGKTGRIAILEKTPGAFAVREGHEWMTIANEAESQEVKRLGLSLPAGSTSHRRKARAEELLGGLAGSLDVPAAVSVLRDRKGAGGRELGPGNRNAIDALITMHSVVLDVSARRAWVAAAPHALGAYVAVDLASVASDAGATAVLGRSAVPEDPFLTSGGYDRYQEARRSLAWARRLERDGAPVDTVLPWLERAHVLSPNFVEAEARLAEALARAGRRERALALVEDALAHDPAPESFRAAAERLALALRAGGPPPKETLPVLLSPDELVDESPVRDAPAAR